MVHDVAAVAIIYNASYLCVYRGLIRAMLKVKEINSAPERKGALCSMVGILRELLDQSRLILTSWL